MRKRTGDIDAKGDDIEPPVGPDDAVIARNRSGEFELLASLFNRSVDCGFIDRLREPGIRFLQGGSQSEIISSDIKKGLSEIAGFIQGIAGKRDEEVEQVLAVDWTRLFRGVSPQYGPPPPFEGLYVQGGANSQEVLQSVSGFYRKNGFFPNPTFHNRPDYMGMELDFMGLLIEREADALDLGDRNEALGHFRAVRSFLSEHLGVWCGDFCDRALPYARTGFYRGVLHLTKGVVKKEVERSGGESY